MAAVLEQPVGITEGNRELFDRDQVRSFRTPMLVLPGVDEPHPTETGREIAVLAPAAGYAAGAVRPGATVGT